MAGTALGHRALPASPLLRARLKRASGHAVNAATQSEADLQLRYIAQDQGGAAANHRHLAVLWGSASGRVIIRLPGIRE
jgi:hypothetical protein